MTLTGFMKSNRIPNNLLLRYTVLFEPAEEGGYVVTCPALPGLVTEGDNYQQAQECAVEALELYLESLQQDGLPFPA
jgi:antitoxin HicB